MILIDKAVGSRELSSVFPLSEVSVLSNLKSADIVFTGNGPDNQLLSIAVEIKSLPDFIDSVRNGRLHGRQTRLMLATYDVNYVAIYGIYRCDTATGDLVYLRGKQWTPMIDRRRKKSIKDVSSFGSSFDSSPKPLQYSFLQSCICSCEAVGLRVKELPFSHISTHMESTRSHLAHWLYYLYSWWTKRWEEHRSICQLDDSRRIIKTTSNLQTMGLTDNELLIANIAKEVPGVQFDRALAIAKEFKSPRAFINASREEIAEIVTTSGKGRQTRIGRVRAETIDLALDGQARTLNGKGRKQ